MDVIEQVIRRFNGVLKNTGNVLCIEHEIEILYQLPVRYFIIPNYNPKREFEYAPQANVINCEDLFHQVNRRCNTTNINKIGQREKRKLSVRFLLHNKAVTSEKFFIYSVRKIHDLFTENKSPLHTFKNDFFSYYSSKSRSDKTKKRARIRKMSTENTKGFTGKVFTPPAFSQTKTSFPVRFGEVVYPQVRPNRTTPAVQRVPDGKGGFRYQRVTQPDQNQNVRRTVSQRTIGQGLEVTSNMSRKRTQLQTTTSTVPSLRTLKIPTTSMQPRPGIVLPINTKVSRSPKITGFSNRQNVPNRGDTRRKEVIEIVHVTPKVVVPHQMVKIVVRCESKIVLSYNSISVSLVLCGPYLLLPREYVISVSPTTKPLDISKRTTTKPVQVRGTSKLTTILPSDQVKNLQVASNNEKFYRYYEIVFCVPELYLPSTEKFFPVRYQDKTLSFEEFKNPKYFRPSSIFPTVIIQHTEGVSKKTFVCEKRSFFRYLLPQYSTKFHPMISYKSLDFRVYSIGPTSGKIGDTIGIYFSLKCPYILPTNSVFHVQFGHTMLSKKGEIVGVYYAQKMNEYRTSAPESAEYVIVVRVPPQPRGVHDNLIRYRKRDHFEQDEQQQQIIDDPRKVRIKVTLMTCPSFGILPGYFEYTSDPYDTTTFQRDQVLEYPRYMNYMDMTLGSYFFQNFLIDCGFPTTLGIRDFVFLKIPISRIKQVCSTYMGFTNSNNHHNNGHTTTKAGKVLTDIMGGSILTQIIARNMTYMTKLVLDLCIENQFNPFTLTDHFGNTPLHYLSLYGYREVSTFIYSKSEYLRLIHHSLRIKNKIQKSNDDMKKFGKFDFFNFRVPVSNTQESPKMSVTREMFSMCLRLCFDGYHNERNPINNQYMTTQTNKMRWRFRDEDEDDDEEEEISTSSSVPTANTSKTALGSDISAVFSDLIPKQSGRESKSSSMTGVLGGSEEKEEDMMKDEV